MVCSWVYKLLQILIQKWCVELWSAHVGGLLIWPKTIQGKNDVLPICLAAVFGSCLTVGVHGLGGVALERGLSLRAGYYQNLAWAWGFLQLTSPSFKGYIRSSLLSFLEYWQRKKKTSKYSIRKLPEKLHDDKSTIFLSDVLSNNFLMYVSLSTGNERKWCHADDWKWKANGCPSELSTRDVWPHEILLDIQVSDKLSMSHYKVGSSTDCLRLDSRGVMCHMFSQYLRRWKAVSRY